MSSCPTNLFSLLPKVILTTPHLRFQQLFFSPVGCFAFPHLSGANAKPTFPQLNLHNTRVRRNPEWLPSSRCIESAQHRAHARILPARASDTALRLTRRLGRELKDPAHSRETGSLFGLLTAPNRWLWLVNVDQVPRNAESAPAYRVRAWTRAGNHRNINACGEVEVHCLRGPEVSQRTIGKARCRRSWKRGSERRSSRRTSDLRYQRIFSDFSL